ncbi:MULTISPECIES: Flp family type IVb pilin [Pseudomonas]|jgi:pilus assembly protein Flp/PilA|uniref:Flp family type IVb pilin n=1 Tax=Pseudomonas umsongensis TaxID=198618 RepID=A0AAE6ZSV9_9PSED|nr:MULTISPECIES: Flp family type IVb pilin [Pseudomonas]MCK8687773.1 Flp family type IVb pilin [Pseudomonas umsongensis]MDI3396417.1 Flp family type IVb pilin [Pseudomonas sp. V98_8]QJC77406.1 Flp family type IVb pilin [Pseudomonas umsongensis]
MSFAKLVQKVKSEIAFYKGLAKDTEGASGIEYAIVAAMVAVVIAGLSGGMGTTITTIFGKITSAMVGAPTGGGGGS